MSAKCDKLGMKNLQNCSFIWFLRYYRQFMQQDHFIGDNTLAHIYAWRNVFQAIIDALFLEYDVSVGIESVRVTHYLLSERSVASRN